MTTKIKQTLIGGIAGTVVMTIVTMVAPMMGMPKMSPPNMLSMMMGFPVAVGWLMHFMIGIMFAAAYVFFFISLLKKVSNKILKGIIFGFAVFVFAQIIMAIMGALMGGMPPVEGSMMEVIVGSIIGHAVYGIVVASIVKVEL